jgi:hypothetical protein
MMHFQIVGVASELRHGGLMGGFGGWMIELVNRFFAWIGLKEKLHQSAHKPPFVSKRDVWAGCPIHAVAGSAMLRVPWGGMGACGK